MAEGGFGEDGTDLMLRPPIADRRSSDLASTTVRESDRMQTRGRAAT